MYENMNLKEKIHNVMSREPYEDYTIGDYVIIDTQVNHKLFPPYIAEIIDIYYREFNGVNIKYTKLRDVKKNKIIDICNDKIVFPFQKGMNIQMKLF